MIKQTKNKNEILQYSKEGPQEDATFQLSPFSRQHNYCKQLNSRLQKTVIICWFCFCVLSDEGSYYLNVSSSVRSDPPG